MSTEKMREEFEAWQTKNMLDHGISEGTARASLARQDGKYGPFVEFAWTVWQASRAALVVELPDSRSLSASDDPWSVRDWCKDAIESAGVRVKA